MLIIRQTLLTSFAILLAGASLIYALDYSDLEALGASCDGRDSCESPKMSSDFHQRNCECDHRCGTFGDCCVDAVTIGPHNNSLLKCMSYGGTPNLGAYVIIACPRGTPSDDCLKDDTSDPVMAAPVSVPGGATYRNVHCAACNGVDLTDIVWWTPLISCSTLAPYNLSANEVLGGLVPDGDAWGVPYQGQIHRCDVLYDKPESVSNVRMCRADVVSTCPDGWRRVSVRRMCERYTAVLHATDAAYKNPHCALCNGVTANDLFCDREEMFTQRLRSTFLLLFDVNRSNGDIVGVNGCPENQKYDPFAKKCRNLVCGMKGYQLVGNKCQKKN